MNVPPCRHRGESPVSPGRFACKHPQVYNPDGVSEADCAACRAAGVFFDSPPLTHAPIVKRTVDKTMWSRPWNLAKALKDFVADGCKTLSVEDYQRRLEICAACPHRERNTCGICGCRLSLKARGRAFQCPLDKWPRIE